jgi:hypothetical protein
MSGTPHRRDGDASPTDPPAAAGAVVPADAPLYAATVVTAADGTDECTVFPVGLSDDDLVTTWVSAAEGSFVPLAEMR